MNEFFKKAMKNIRSSELFEALETLSCFMRENNLIPAFSLPTASSALAYCLGLRYGKHLERQRRRARQEARISDNADLWKADDETVDELFNSLAPSDQRYVLISGLHALTLQS